MKSNRKGKDMRTKKLFKRTLAGLLSAFMVITSVPATSMAVYAEETPVVELAEAVEESTVVETTVVEETEEITLVESTEVTTEEETTTVEEVTTEVETTTEEVALEEDEATFKVIFENENNVAVMKVEYADYDADKEYKVDDLSGIMNIVIGQNPEVTGYAIGDILYKIGESGSYKTLKKQFSFYYIEVEELTGEDVYIKVASREKGNERTVTIDVDPDVEGIYYYVDKAAKPSQPDYNDEPVLPVDGKIEIKVEDQYYLFISGLTNAQPRVYKDGKEVQYVYDPKECIGYYPIGQITKDTDGISVDIDLRAETTIDVAANAATVNYASGYSKVLESRVYYGTDGTKDFKVSAVAKPGYSIEKIEAIPLITRYSYDAAGETVEIEEDTAAAVAFAEDFSTHANWYVLNKADLKQLIRTRDDSGSWKYISSKTGNILMKIKVTTKAAQETVTFPTEDVNVYLATLDENGEPVFEETPVDSTVVDYNTAAYFGVQVKDPTHKTLATVAKASGTATVAKVTSKKGVVYYKATGIKSDVTIKATTTLAKAAGGARFVFEPEEGIAGNVKVTSVKGATYDRANDEYKVNANVSEVVVTLTANAPYVPSLGGAEVAPKPAGAAYSYTFTIPAVDISNTDKGETVDIASYAITSELKTVRVDADFNPETTELVSIAEGTIGLYAGDTYWYVPFGSSMTVIVKAKDNCKLTTAYVNDKKVAFAKNEKITFKVTDLEADTFKIDSQKLLKTIVESNGAAITGKGTTYNVLKQYNAAVYVQEGADGKLDLTDENVAITAKIGRDDVPYTISEDKINFTTETIDSVAGKTITVTIKDGKKAVSTTKLVVSAKCTSVKVQGEKKVDGVDTIYLETATKKEPVLKITYNPGVNPADMVLKYVDASGRDAELDISDGVLHPAYMDMISQSDFSLKKEIEVRFVDRSQGDKVVATKNFVLTAKGFENAAPTVKAVSSSDTEVVLSIAKPKVSGIEMACIYNITATQVVAKGKLPVEGMYGADVADPEVVFNNVKPDENGKVTLKLTDLSAGSGKACNYSFTVSGTYFVPSNVNYKPVTVKAATKAPKYETALKLVNKKVKFYADEGEVLVGTAKFSTATTHKEDLKATFFTYVNGEKYSIADNGEIGHIRIDDDYNIYVNVTQYGELTYEIPAGSYYLEIEAAKDPNAEKASTAKTTITILQPIKEITAKYVSSETLAPDYPTLAYRYEPGKVLTIPAPAVSYVGDSEHNIVPAIKKVQWSIEDYSPDSGIKIDANTGKITIAKDINFEGSFTLNVKAKAADFEKNSTSTTCVLVILPKVDFEVKVMEQSPYEGKPDITHEPNMYEEVKLFTSYTDKRIEVKNPVAGATYTYSSSNSEVIKVTPDGHFTFKNDPSASTLGAMITITQKKGTVTKKSRVYVYYENSED